MKHKAFACMRRIIAAVIMAALLSVTALPAKRADAAVGQVLAGAAAYIYILKSAYSLGPGKPSVSNHPGCRLDCRIDWAPWRA